MSVPICPRLAPTWDATWDSDFNKLDGGKSPEWADCQGSDCAMWVPEVMTAKGGNPWNEGWISIGPKASVSGRGWCANNLRREPWPDPAHATKPASPTGEGRR